MSALADARTAAAEYLRTTTGDDRPEWRVTFLEYAVEPNAIAPVCTDDEHVASEEPGAFGCCPDPVIAVESAAVALYLVELLNADREAGESA
ncbi:hypothetical protein [Streptomyces sp. NPDC001450]